MAWNLRVTAHQRRATAATVTVPLVLGFDPPFEGREVAGESPELLEGLLAELVAAYDGEAVVWDPQHPHDSLKLHLFSAKGHHTLQGALVFEGEEQSRLLLDILEEEVVA